MLGGRFRSGDGQRGRDGLGVSTRPGTSMQIWTPLGRACRQNGDRFLLDPFRSHRREADAFDLTAQLTGASVNLERVLGLLRPPARNDTVSDGQRTVLTASPCPDLSSPDRTCPPSWGRPCTMSCPKPTFPSADGHASWTGLARLWPGSEGRVSRQ
jgi:hypothetical protein